jgi:hypothetical protein
MALNRSYYERYEPLYPKEGRIAHFENNTYLYGEAPPYQTPTRVAQSNPTTPQHLAETEYKIQLREIDNESRHSAYTSPGQ